ncbi:MAG: thiamine pyrophosphate-dependent dehydrogenase E1 component subunit alpha [Desulfobacterota bacterium]|nr:thiamine pyrophosphate-dependent dehydrogenase E1 component subunit alpha [Thermodesulfobacteriota bacterium]
MKISKETKIDLFTRMVKIRTFEDETHKIFMAGKEMPGFLHLSQGEEAMAVGTCANLTFDDAIYTTHRGHGCIIAKGADLKPMMAELFGRIDGCCKGRAGSMHFADVKTGCMGSNGIVGEGMRLAIGTAFAQKYQKTKNVTAVFFGDGATGTGAFHESFNMAATLKLPVIFVCSINFYAQMTHKSVHIPIEHVADRAAGYGAPGVTIDGNDVELVYEEVSKAVKHCRAGKGPYMIEGITYRHHGHFIGDPCNYRPAGELEEWLKKDPIVLYEQKLLKEGVLDEKRIQQIKEECKNLVDEAVAFARQSPQPDIEELYKDILA